MDSSWRSGGDDLWVRKYEPASGTKGSFTLRVRKLDASRFRWEAWRGATLVRSGERASLDEAQRDATELALTSSGAPARIEIEPAAGEDESSSVGIVIRFGAAAGLVLVGLWQFVVFRSTGEIRGLVVAVAGLLSVAALVVLSRRRRY